MSFDSLLPLLFIFYFHVFREVEIAFGSIIETLLRIRKR